MDNIDDCSLSPIAGPILSLHTSMIVSQIFMVGRMEW